ncbi:hypothetical protein COCON_G00203100 [Conger conger]|uniref:Uncharacterized protein n=1 Tax=Conger conger TaxID=82655 RepID=A0A9Q1CZL3_CONCO|nr:hypothetical protein COCON_G00203100 [Conger conger]
MDIERQFGGIHSRIGVDYGALDSLVEYIATFVLCWGKKKYGQQKEVVTDFMNLRESGLIPWYVSVEDMKAWIISEDQAIVKERFQMEDSGREDGLVYLTWEVNIRLKLQEIERACRQVCGNQGLGPLSPLLACDQNPHQAALTDLQSPNGGVLPPGSLSSRYEFVFFKFPDIFDARAVVQRALKDILHKLAYQPASRPQPLPDVVVDVVSSLLQVITDEGGARDGARDETDMRLLSSMAVGTVVSVLHAVRADFSQTVEFSRATRDGMVAFIFTELQSNVGSPQALKGALCSKEANTTAAIATEVTAAVRQLCQDTQAFSSPSVTPAPIRDEAIMGEVKLVEEEDNMVDPLHGSLGTVVQVAVMEMQDGEIQDTSAITTADTEASSQLSPVECALPGMAVMEPGEEDFSGSTESLEVASTVQQDDTEELLLGDLATADPQVAVMELKAIQDGTLKLPASSPLWSVPSPGMAVMEPGEEDFSGSTESLEVASTVQQDDTEELLLGDLATADPQVAVMELKAIQDGETQDTSTTPTADTEASSRLSPVEPADPGMAVMEPGEEDFSGSMESLEVASTVQQGDTEDEMQDARAVDEQKGPLGDVDIDQPGVLPQRTLLSFSERGKKRALQRFFGRFWKALKSSLCCCSVPEGEE